jgi:predicted HicB family RNase H-like nuclease
MEHRGYTGSVAYDAGERIFYGEVLDLTDAVTYEAISEELLETAFRDAIDEYIDQCCACEQEPERPRASLAAAA